MSGTCCDTNEEIMILACSGGSNVGQLTNQAAVELTREGFGKMFCLAGIGGGIKSFSEAAAKRTDVVVLDGCPVGCAKAVLAREGVPLKGYVVVTDLGVQKVKDTALEITQDDLAKVKQAAKASLAFARQAGRGPSCDCRWPQG